MFINTELRGVTISARLELSVYDGRYAPMGDMLARTDPSTETKVERFQLFSDLALFI